MKSFFDKLNLRPQERRLVVIVGIIVFVVINVVFVYPIFGDYGKTMKLMDKTRNDLKRFEMEIRRKGFYEEQLRKLEGAGSFVAQEEMASQLMEQVQVQQRLSGVDVRTWNPTPRGSASGKTNAFFEEQTLAITIANTGEKELIDFLYNLGSGGSLIRVRTMTLAPEPNRYKLQGNLTLVESFQKKPPKASAAPPPAKSAAAPAPSPAPGPAATNKTTRPAKADESKAGKPTQPVKK